MIVSRPNTVMNQGIPAAGSRPGPFAAPQPERREIVARLGVRVAQPVPRGVELRHSHVPGVERVPHAGTLGAEATGDEGRVLDVAVERDENVDAHIPRFVRRELDGEADALLGDVRQAGQEYLCAALPPVSLLEHDLAGGPVVARSCREGER